ncbi:MAG: chemotaxis-specific protein-glutamate methyltransferase CheB [Deltaproteobacteria bacterium]|nr:chemotaxis-specific protein-glutamate methyltransferase CheB [Deltaproteobacteria bacterium]
MDQTSVLIVDDSVIYRKILKDVLEEMDDIRVVGTTANGDLALKRLAVTHCDVVLCDVEMPVMGGIDTLKAIQQKYPEKGVVMVSSPQKHNAGIVLEALDLGALDFIVKPDGNNIVENKEYLKEQISNVVSVFNSQQRNKKNQPLKSIAKKPLVEAKNPIVKIEKQREIIKPSKVVYPTRIDIVAIGVSTGGPNALGEVIPKLSAQFPVPMVMVQHMPPLFTASLADSLNKKSAITVVEAKDGMELSSGVLHIAPGGKHMIVTEVDGSGKRYLKMNDDPPENSCRPSVDVLFRSISRSYGGNTLAVVMTGMGSDGKEGVANIVEAGSAWIITQSSETCTVYGMPASVDQAGLSNEQIPLNELANRIETIVRLPRLLRKK